MLGLILKRFGHLGSQRRNWILLRSFLVVLCVRIGLTLRLTRRITKRIAIERSKSAAPPHDRVLHDIREVAWSVSAVSRFVPYATCLTQALAGDYLLARRGQPGEVQLSLPEQRKTGLRRTLG